MYFVQNYKYVDGAKNTACIKCKQDFSHNDKVILCEVHHVFHEKCWTGACTTEICKSEANRRLWKPIQDFGKGMLHPLTFIANDSVVGMMGGMVSVATVITVAMLALKLLSRRA